MNTTARDLTPSIAENAVSCLRRRKITPLFALNLRVLRSALKG